MPKRITNYLTEGLPAKIYLLCYLQPQSGYGLAKSIYHNKPITAKIYGWTKRLVQEGYLSYDSKKERYSAKPAHLVSEIKSILKSKGLTMENADYRDLITLVESDQIKSLVQKYSGEEKARESNILELVCETISTFAASSYFIKTIWQIPDVPISERKEILEFMKMNAEGALPDATYAEALAITTAINKEIIKTGLVSRSDFPNNDTRVLSDLIQSGALQFVVAPASFLEILSQLTPAGALMVEISKFATEIPGIMKIRKKLNESNVYRVGTEK